MQNLVDSPRTLLTVQEVAPRLGVSDATVYRFSSWSARTRSSAATHPLRVLPIVFGDRLVGRIEPRIDRDEGVVQVLDVWGEDGFAPRRADGFVDAMRDALRAYLRFGEGNRLDWAPHLVTEKRLFLARP